MGIGNCRIESKKDAHPSFSPNPPIDLANVELKRILEARTNSTYKSPICCDEEMRRIFKS
jgi:hypothetical protein